MIKMPDHDHVEQPVMREGDVGLKLAFPPAPRNVGKGLVAVAPARAVTREMLRYRHHVRLAMRGDEGAGERRHGVVVCAVASLPPHDDRIPGIDAEIDHRTEIDVDPGTGELLRHLAVDAPRSLWCQRRIAPQRLR